MATDKGVASFLKDFKEKMNFWDVLFRDDRGKNSQALVDLELRPVERKTILEALEPQDYCEGPLKKNFMEVLICGYSAKPSKKEKYILK